MTKEELIEELNRLDLKKINERDIERRIYEIEAIAAGSKAFVMD